VAFVVVTFCLEITAAGLFGIFTRFPFNPIARKGKSEQNAAKVRLFFEKGPVMMNFLF